jgi:mono/diheme cytochrome c family protein
LKTVIVRRHLSRPRLLFHILPPLLFNIFPGIRMNRSFVRVAFLFSAAVASSACHHAGIASSTTASPSATPQGSAAARASNAMPAGVTVASIALGDSLFHAKTCVRCHGADAKGAQNGPDLTTSTHLHVDGTYPAFVKLITSGVPKDSIKEPSHRFAMQPRGGSQSPLTDDQVLAVAAYVYSLSHK